MIRCGALALILLLAACGADGPPERPEREEAPRAGVTISGDIGIGVSGGSVRVR